jgi:MarR family transcriptional regulator, organic hydroperoxide resistance regulator
MDYTARKHGHHHHEFDERTPAHAAFAAFGRAMHAHRQLMMNKLSEHHVHPAQTFCMKALSTNDGITQRDLAQLLNIARPTATVMLQKMEKAGLIERRVDEQDQRYTRIYLSEEGWALHDEMHGIIDEIITSGISPMPESDQEELARLLGMFADNIQASLGTTPSPQVQEPLPGHGKEEART